MSKTNMDMKDAIESAEYMPQVQIVSDGQWPIMYENTWMMRKLRRIADKNGIPPQTMLRAILTLWLHEQDW